MSIKDQKVNSLSFAGHTASVTTKLCPRSTKPAVDDTETNRCGRVPVTLYLQTRAAAGTDQQATIRKPCAYVLHQYLLNKFSRFNITPLRLYNFLLTNCSFLPLLFMTTPTLQINQGSERQRELSRITEPRRGKARPITARCLRGSRTTQPLCNSRRQH